MKTQNPSRRAAWDSSNLHEPPRAPLRRAGTNRNPDPQWRTAQTSPLPNYLPTNVVSFRTYRRGMSSPTSFPSAHTAVGCSNPVPTEHLSFVKIVCGIGMQVYQAKVCSILQSSRRCSKFSRAKVLRLLP